MPETCAYDKATNGGAQPYHRIMVIRKVESGYHGTVTNCTWGQQICTLATVYFIKWVEAEAYGTITQTDVTKFVWHNIICRFEIPKAIVLDNGTQFNNQKFMKYYMEKGISQQFLSHSYPQGNGQAERAS